MTNQSHDADYQKNAASQADDQGYLCEQRPDARTGLAALSEAATSNQEQQFVISQECH